MPDGFKSIQLFKEETLGIGSYGKVCQAKCDNLLCAAKIIHETLFDPTAVQQMSHGREHRLPTSMYWATYSKPKASELNSEVHLIARCA